MSSVDDKTKLTTTGQTITTSTVTNPPKTRLGVLPGENIKEKQVRIFF